MLYFCFLIENYLDSPASIFRLIWFYFYSVILEWPTSGFDTYISSPLVFQFKLEQLNRISLLPPNLSKSLSHYLFWLCPQNFICPQKLKQILVKLIITIWDFLFSSQFESLSFITIEFLSIITIWVFELNYNSSYWVSSQFEFWSFITIWILEFHHSLSF